MAIITPFGLFEFIRMSFGLSNGAQAFQRFMDFVLRDFDFDYAHIDEILIASKIHAEHGEHVRRVLQRLQEFGLVVNSGQSVRGRAK